MNRIVRTYWVLKALGWDNVPRRVWQMAKGKLGMHRRTLPGGELSAARMQQNFAPGYRPADATEHWRRRLERFILSPARLNEIRALLPQVAGDKLWQERVTHQAAELHRGRMLFFSHHWVNAGWPVNFNRDPLHNVEWPTGKHWSTYKQFDPTLDDIKCVWEGSRFAWAFALARQYVRDPQAQFSDAAGKNAISAAELFWQTFEQWDYQNPYGLTPNWVCGQEATFRLFACLFAVGAMQADPATTPARLARMSEIVWYIARHIEGNINYARGQKNNHAISEAIGMYTIGLLFPEYAKSARWREYGKRVLAIELDRQIYDDGSFVQHSVNYHRLMLHDVIWAIAVARAAGDELPAAVYDRAGRALEWLRQMIDPSTGGAPNYGHNDGALILPLTCCDYTEYRPAVQTLSLLLNGQRAYAAGPWDEEGAWLANSELRIANNELEKKTAAASNSLFATRNSKLFPDGGYYTFAGPRSWGLIRCHTFRDRPAHADMLHFDLWYDGVNVLCDGGTLSYFCPQPWQHWFRSTAAHNTVEIAGQDQMIPGPNFLWLRWTRANGGQRSAAGGRLDWFLGEDRSYHRSGIHASHWREVWRLDDAYVVRDHVQGDLSERSVALRWRLGLTPTRNGPSAWQWRIGKTDYELRLVVPADVNVCEVRGETTPQPAGWRSRYYGEQAPATTIEAAGKLRWSEFVTIIRPLGGLEVIATLTGEGAVGALKCSDPALQAAIDELSDPTLDQLGGA